MNNDTYVTGKGGVRKNILIHGVSAEGRPGSFATEYALDHTLLAKSEAGARSILENGSRYASSEPYFNQDANGNPVSDMLTESRITALEDAGAEIVWDKNRDEFVGYVNASFSESAKAKSADGRPMLYIDVDTVSPSTRPFKATRFVTAKGQWDKVAYIASLQRAFEQSQAVSDKDVKATLEIEVPDEGGLDMGTQMSL